MLARARLRNHPRLAHPLGNQDLTDRVVDLVSAGVVQILSLEINVRAADHLGKPFRQIKRRRSTHVVLVQVVHLSLEVRVILEVRVSLRKLGERIHQGFGDKPAAERPEPAKGVWKRRGGRGGLKLGFGHHGAILERV